jgi:hypothetical protein
MKLPERDSPRTMRNVLILLFAIVAAMFAWRVHASGLNHLATVLAASPSGHPGRVALHQG